MMELQEYNMIDEFQFKDMCMQICEYCLYICLNLRLTRVDNGHIWKWMKNENIEIKYLQYYLLVDRTDSSPFNFSYHI